MDRNEWDEEKQKDFRELAVADDLVSSVTAKEYVYKGI